MKAEFKKMKKTGIPTRTATAPSDLMSVPKSGTVKKSSKSGVSVPNNSRNKRYNLATLKRAARKG